MYEDRYSNYVVQECFGGAQSNAFAVVHSGVHIAQWSKIKIFQIMLYVFVCGTVKQSKTNHYLPKNEDNRVKIY